jgi:hypothetical protein
MRDITIPYYYNYLLDDKHQRNFDKTEQYWRIVIELFEDFLSYVYLEKSEETNRDALRQRFF